MKFFNQFGIRQKFLIILGASYFVVGLFLFFYFPSKQSSDMKASLAEKSKAIAQMVSKSSAAGLVFDDASSVTTQFETFKDMPDVEFVTVLKKDGSRFAVFNESKYGNYSAQVAEMARSKGDFFSDGKVLLAMNPIISDKETVGAVVIAMNTAAIDAQAFSARIVALVISLLIFVLGLVGMRIFFTKVIYTPIKNLTVIADRLSKGDVSIEIASAGNDEIAQLEKSFNAIVTSTKDQSRIAELIANGDLSTEAVVKSDLDILSQSMNKVVVTLRNLISEVSSLATSAAEGNLSARGNASIYNGGYQQIVEGFNLTLDTVINPVIEGSGVLEKMATGDLTVSVDGDYKGDHQLLKTRINGLGESLKLLISDITEAVQATASASNQISSSSEEMAAGAQEQSSKTIEVAGAVEEMAKTIVDTTKNSTAAAEAARNAGVIAREGGTVVNQTIEGMNRVAEVVKKSAVTVQELGNNSNKIGEIVQVIDDIADQTNLLALNAAIEAARAGEQGRGFAVVADEVRKLAERTTKATKEIGMMIKQIQKDTEGAVLSMKEGTEEVERGKALADKAGHSLGQIINGSEEVVNMVTCVAAANEEQSATAEEISKNIEGINTITQDSAQGVQQIARASEDLSKLTVNLQELITRFKIDDSPKSLESGRETTHQLAVSVKKHHR
ncbi:MAG TPA: methyl-accepting chemotaxis protein [Bacteroidota bacterium]|nr:methyl-accepting chemotaxis protein [Bacteroidota bacterium]